MHVLPDAEKEARIAVGEGVEVSVQAAWGCTEKLGTCRARPQLWVARKCAWPREQCCRTESDLPEQRVHALAGQRPPRRPPYRLPGLIFYINLGFLLNYGVKTECKSRLRFNVNQNLI